TAWRLAMARVLVYGINHAPEPTGIGKYSGEMTAWLAARGHEVDVIAAVPHYPAWRIFDGYEDRFSEEEVDGVHVWRTPLFVPPVEQAGALGRIRLETSYSVNALRYWLVLARPPPSDGVMP